MQLRAQREHGSAITGLRSLSNGTVASWAQTTNEARVWNSGGELLFELAADLPVDGVLELRDGRLLTWALDRRMRLWGPDGSLLNTTEPHHGYIKGVLELHDGRLLSWAQDHKPRIWSSTGSPIRLLAAHGGQVYGMLELLDGRLFSWASHSYPRLWSPDGDLLRTLGYWGFFFIRLRDDMFACWSGTDYLYVLNLDGGEIQMPPRRDGPTTCGGIELSNGHLVSWAADFLQYSFTGTRRRERHEYDHALRVWNRDGKRLSKLQGHNSRVRGIIELANEHLVSWSDDGQVRLWSIDGKVRRVIAEHAARVVGALELSNAMCISWAQDGSLCVWDNAGKVIDRMQESAPILHCVELKKDRTIITGGAQGRLIFLE